MRFRAIAVTSLVLFVPLAMPEIASAQQPGAAPAAAPAQGTVTQGTPATGGTTSTTTVVVQPAGPPPPYGPNPAPVAPGGVLGGGNVTTSSSKPITGPNDRDGFDLGRSAGSSRTGNGSGVVRGSEGGNFVFLPGSGGATRGSDANLHTVRRGDTLWGICDAYYKNPYQWPRIWSYNPQIQNPHWIYPGDQVRLRGNGPAAVATNRDTGKAMSLTDKRRQVTPDTIFLRTQGFIETSNDAKEGHWGEISGSREDKMILTDFDFIYMKMKGDHDVKVGQELTIFRPVKKVGDGQLVQIQGTVRVDQWDAKEKVARGRITETLDAIERGAQVGPLQRRFEVVSAKPNDNDVRATVLSSVYPYNLYGQNQVLFINRGTKEGLQAGNRLFVVRQGDQWHSSLPNSDAAKRIALESDSPAQTESVPRPSNESKLPEEVQGEIRVIAARDHNSLCVVTNARHEIEPGDVAVARKGY